MGKIINEHNILRKIEHLFYWVQLSSVYVNNVIPKRYYIENLETSTSNKNEIIKYRV